MCSKGNQSQTSQIGSCRHRLPISLKTANSATVGTVQYIQNAHCFTKDATSDRFRLLARNSVIVGSIGYISFDGPSTLYYHSWPLSSAAKCDRILAQTGQISRERARKRERERERERERNGLSTKNVSALDRRRRWTAVCTAAPGARFCNAQMQMVYARVDSARLY